MKTFAPSGTARCPRVSPYTPAMDLRSEEQDLVRETARELAQQWGVLRDAFSRETGPIDAYLEARLLRTALIRREMVLHQVAEHVLGLPPSY